MAKSSKSKRPRRKAKPRPGKKSASSAWRLPLGTWGRLAWGFILGATLVLLVWALLPGRAPLVSKAPETAASHTRSAPSKPVYEELQPGKPQKLRPGQVAGAVFTGLSAAGIAPSRAKPVANGNGDVLLVRLRPGEPARQVMRLVSDQLIPLGVSTVWNQLGRNWELTAAWGRGSSYRLRLWSPAPGPGAPPSGPAPRPAPRPRGVAALVIDDLGYDLGAAKKLLATGLELTYSILPYGPHSREISRLARGQGRQVLLHMPMQPKSYPGTDPGPGALLLAMKPGGIHRQSLANLAEVPGAAGVNNHMGSAFTENPAALAPMMKVLAAQHLFFLDSLTSPRSRAARAARGQGVRFGQRNLFIDHDPGPQAVKKALQRFIALAQSGHPVIAIAHPHPATVAAISKMAPRLRQRIKLAPVGDLLPEAIQRAAVKSRSARP